MSIDQVEVNVGMRFPDLVNPSGDISILIGRLHLVGRNGTRMVQSEIDAIRTMLSSKPRPVGWAERRRRIDEVGSVWPVADDIALTPVNAAGVPAEWSLAPGERCVPGPDVSSWRGLLLGIDPQPSAHGDRGGQGGWHAHASHRL